jgi:uncharacterized protein (DUF885 family)
MEKLSNVAALAGKTLDVMAEEDPLNDALEGYAHFADRLADLHEGAQQELRSRAVAIAAEAAKEVESLDSAVVVQQAESVIARIDARLVEHTMSGYDHSPLGRLLGVLPLARPSGRSQERDFLSRLAAIPGFLDGAAARHRSGVAASRTPVAERAAHAVGRIDAYLADVAGDPFHAVPLPAAAAAERDRLLTETVRPALAAYRAVLHCEIAPHGRPPERAGLCWVTGGEQSYAGLVRMHTTTGRTPEQLHQTGIGLIDELNGEYGEIGAQAFGDADAQAVRQRLRTDPALRWQDAAAILAAAREVISRAESVAPSWFSARPTESCVVAASPDADGPSAYYLPPALDGSRPGTYFANVGTPTERTRFVAEATAFHEAVPGHHFQLSLAQGLSELLPLRRLAWINSYVEGWGLYAERLADEMGLYSGPLARLGMLAMDSLRAARLVVDTGLHAFGWSRARAVEYLQANTVLSGLEASSEIDRYIEFPAQALSYMVGRLEFQRLRKRSEAELGVDFDVRSFHELVLGNGPLPMALLDSVVGEWSVGKRASSARGMRQQTDL